MTKLAIHNSILPHREDVDNNHCKIYFTTPIGDNKQKYVVMHDSDKEYIFYWFERFVCDVVAGQIKDQDTLFACLEEDDSLPVSSYTKRRNSILSYCAGVVSNNYRNSSEDFGKKQLKHIKRIFEAIHYYYSNCDKNNLGYNHITKQQNTAPKKVMFKKV